jgi:hypothetical protein
LAQVEVEAQPDPGLAGFVGGAVGCGGGPAGGDRVLEGERGVVVGGRDFHDEEPGLGYVPCVDRFHARHDAPTGGGASGRRRFHPVLKK